MADETIIREVYKVLYINDLLLCVKMLSKYTTGLTNKISNFTKN